MGEVIIRDAVPQDAKRLSEIYAFYVEKTAISYEYDAPTEMEFRERIRHTLQEYPFLVIEEDGIVQGYAYAGVFKDREAYDWSCEVSVYIEKNARWRGFGRSLYQALEERLKERGIENLYACIAYPEVPDEYLTKNSYDFHEHMGYTLVGEFHKCAFKFKRWYNMVWMEKMIGEHKVR